MNHSELVSTLRKRAQEAGFRIQQTKINSEKREAQENTMKSCHKAVLRLDKGIAQYNLLLSAISTYTDERREDSNTAILGAMRAAAYIVPSCDDTIIPKCEDGEAWFETNDGIDVARLEGSGFRSILSVMVRAVVLRANHKLLQTLVLDEIFAKLSVENSATLSTYLPILAQDMQIISIEQKPEVFANNSHVAYKFFLDGDHTVVRKEDISYA